MRLSSTLPIIALSSAVYGLPQQDKKTLVWEPCPELNEQIADIYNGIEITPFDCAHLEVPLDYHDPDTSRALTLDLFKVNATKEPVLGSILYNPGGPGGAGAENLPINAPDLHLNIGGQYNLVTWDPRGTGNTIPFNCGLSDAMTNDGSASVRREVPTLASPNITEAFLNSGWDQAVQLADACEAAMNDTGRYIGTGSVACDMMEIVDALDEDGLLRYYGWSYGSALGDYVAAMFPDRVERMVLDGNVNPHTWQLGYRPEFLEATDKAFAAFVDECVANGEDCALTTALNVTTSAEIFEAFNAVFSPLAENATSGGEAFQALVASDALIYKELYFPEHWPKLAKTLADTLLGVASQTPDLPPRIQ